MIASKQGLSSRSVDRLAQVLTASAGAKAWSSVLGRERGESLARLQFRWENLPADLIQAITDDLGIAGDTVFQLDKLLQPLAPSIAAARRALLARAR